MSMAGCAGESRVSVSVVDEGGKPIPQATVAALWIVPGSGDGWGGGTQYGKTPIIVADESGRAEFAVGNIPSISAGKDGYYGYGISYELDTPPIFQKAGKSGEPIHFTIPLTKKVNPHPMYVRKIEGPPGHVPEIGKDIGFDLLVGEWVKPWGTGIHNDIVVHVEGAEMDSENYWYVGTISFPDPGSGFIYVPVRYKFPMNDLRLPCLAPESGYQSLYKRDIKRTKTTSSKDFYLNSVDDNYIFRVRTSSNDKGEVIGGLYGKIYGSIGIRLKGINLQYYLNATPGEHNIEWDTINNLAGSRHDFRPQSP
jgi:hypothetical protein